SSDVCSSDLRSDAVADGRAAHAPRPAAAAAQLGAGHLDDLDAVGPQVGVGRRVALVGDDDAGLERQDVARVVPLLALGAEGVLRGGEDAQGVHAQRLGEDRKSTRLNSSHVKTSYAV